MSRTTLLAAALALAALALPGTAAAATATVTGDTGAPVALVEGSTVQLRHMSPAITPSFSDTEKRYTLKVFGPDAGREATLGAVCASTSNSDLAQTLKYQGDGTYTVQLLTTADENDFYCEQNTTTQTFSFAISAATTLTAPGTQLLLRTAGTTNFVEHVFKVGLVPGAAGYGIQHTVDGGTAEEDVNSVTGEAAITFPHTGVYSMAAWAFAGDGNGPLSAPQSIKVVAPFDWADKPYLKDARGPKYRIVGKTLGDEGAGQRIEVSAARGKGKFKRLATPKMSDVGSFGFSFKQRKKGRYRFKYVFKGAEFMLPGTYTHSLRLR